MTKFFDQPFDNELGAMYEYYLQSSYFKNLRPDFQRILSISPFYRSGLLSGELFTNNPKVLYFAKNLSFHRNDDTQRMSVTFNCSCGGFFILIAKTDAVFSSSRYYETEMNHQNTLIYNLQSPLNINWFEFDGYRIEIETI